MTSHVNEKGETLLVNAINLGQGEMARLLIDHIKTEADTSPYVPKKISLVEWINLTNEKLFRMTAVHYAALMGDLPTFKILVKNGGDIHMRDSNGMTVLHFAAQSNYVVSNHVGVIIYLLDCHNYDINVMQANR